ncbi:MAG: hypothetical protein QOE63_1869 [Acidimicrobiaceae bacterium]|jgi:hypothetical protein
MEAARDESKERRTAAGLALASAVAAILGVGQTWLRISVAGVHGPGDAQTGWDGRDGWTVAVAAAVAAIAAIGLLIGRRDVWLRVSLFVAGGTMLVVSLVNLAGVRSKADDIHVLFGIPTSDVQAQIGVGLILVAFASFGVVGGAIVAHRIDT